MKILLLEDDPFNQEVIKDMLTIIADELGLELDIDLANNGKEGVDMYEANSNYDLVLTDMDMPIMKGDEVLENIKSKNPNQKVIVLTAFGLQGDKERLLVKGFDDYVSKPIDYDILKETIEKHVRN